MSINDARLTDEEIKQCGQALVTSNLSRMVPGFAEAVARRVADAQLAKALWGMVDWLEEMERTHAKASGGRLAEMARELSPHFETVKEALLLELEETCIPRPGGGE